MQGKVVVVTGAKGGLGTYVTKAFLAAGATVVGVSRSIAQSDFPDPKFAAIAADVSDPTAASALAEQVVQRFGRIDALVHVMGGFAGGKPVDETDDVTWERMRDLNLNSAFYAARAVLPHLRKSAGRLVAIGSKAADAPHPGLGAYGAFKSALVSLVRTIAAENGDAGVTANVILPGTMDTPANRMNEPGADYSKWVQPEQVAKLILFLTSDDARQVNGAVIPISGSNV